MNKLLVTYPLTPTTRLEICQGNLTQEAVDAIVNAANRHLEHGGGIAAAISREGGPVINHESQEWVRKNGPVSHASPAYTHGGDLPARYVIHAVGPVWGSGDEDRKLADAIRGSLARAEELGLRSIAFPAISTGIFGFPINRAARINFQIFRGFFSQEKSSPLTLVRLVLWSDKDAQVFLEEGRRAFENG